MCTTMALAALFIMEYYAAIKKTGILPFATTWMDLENIMLSEISQRNTNTVGFHLYVDYKNTKMNKQNKNRLIETETKGGVGLKRRRGMSVTSW